MLLGFGLELLQNFFMVLHIGGNSFPRPLKPEEENFYIKNYENGNEKERKEAKDVLIERNLRLVAHIVKKFQNNTETDDLISVGTIGLIKGIASFDSKKGTKLATYASRCIENEVLMYLRSKKKYSLEVPLDGPIGQDSDGNQVALIERIEYAEDFDIDDAIFLKDQAELLHEAIENLDSRERQIIEMRYGIFPHEETTQLRIAEKLNISRSYVSRLEKKTLGILRNLIKAIEEKKKQIV